MRIRHSVELVPVGIGISYRFAIPEQVYQELIRDGSQERQGEIEVTFEVDRDILLLQQNYSQLIPDPPTPFKYFSVRVHSEADLPGTLTKGSTLTVTTRRRRHA